LLALLDAGTTLCVAVGIRKWQQYHTDFQNDRIKKRCPHSAPDPEQDFLAQGREAAGSSLGLWSKATETSLYHYIM